MKATRHHAKEINIRLVLKNIYEHGPLSRADVARATKLTRPTVSSLVEELIQDNLVAAVGIGRSTGGKRPMLLEVPSDARQMVCVDISSRNFYGALMTLRGEIVCKQTLSAEDHPGATPLTTLCQLITYLVEKSSKPLLGIAVGTPGIIDTDAGVVRRAILHNWTDLPLRSMLASHFNLPIYLVNDSNAAALAEYMYGSGSRQNNVISIRLGYGIGSGIVLNDTILTGDHFSAGEIGQIVAADVDGELLPLEQIIGKEALMREAQAIFGRNTSWEELCFAPETASLRQRVGHHLGVTIATLISTLNIEQIVFSGQMIQFGQQLLDSIKTTAERYTLPFFVDKTALSFSTLGNEIVLLGCSALLIKYELGIL